MPRITTATNTALAGRIDPRRPRRNIPAPDPGWGSTQGNNFGESVAIDQDLALIAAPNERLLRQTLAGRVYVYETATWTKIAELENPTPTINDDPLFGAVCAISDSYILVTAPNESQAGSLLSGRAYLFDRSTRELVREIANPNAVSTPAQDYFGSAAALSDQWTVISATYERTADNSTPISGVVYVFDTATGELVYTLFNPNESGSAVFDRFGNRVALAGSRLAVGTLENPPRVYLYDLTTGLQERSVPAVPVSNSGFGSDLALSADYLVVGAQEDDNQGTNSGRVYVFAPATGNLLFTIDNPSAYSTVTSDFFGSAVALSGTRLAVGAQLEGDALGFSSGKVYTYDLLQQEFVPAASPTLEYTLDNPNAYDTSAGDTFGISVAIDGDRCIVGAYFEDDAGGTDSGKAYIFDVTTGALLHTLDNPNAYSTSAGDTFGVGVAISGDRCIVGAYLEGDAGGLNSGKAYIFDVTTGALVHTLDNPNAFSTSAGDTFGYSVSISGDRCIVGAYFEDDATGGNSGKAYIFDVTDGSLLHTLDNPNAYDTSAGDGFGISVAISGDRCIVGAYQEDDAGGLSSGKAYIFDVTSGLLLHTLDNPNAFSTSDNDRFGWSVDIDGDRCIVGAYFEDDAGGTTSGKAYIFDVTDGSLLHTLDNPNAYDTSAGDQFGHSVSISGDRCIVGAYTEDDASGLISGKAYIFSVTDGSLLHTLDNPNAYGTSTGDQFSWSVSIRGDRCIVGARLEDDAGGTSSGKAYIYSLPVQLTLLQTLDNPNAYGTTTNDQFGRRLAISGSQLLVGVPFEGDAQGTTSGVAYVFDADLGTEVTRLANPDSIRNLVNGGKFGNAVAMTDEFTVITMPEEYGPAGSEQTNSGRAFVYRNTTGELLYTLENPNAYGTEAGDQFGLDAVAASGTRCIIGAKGEDDVVGASAGRAYIFDLTDGTLERTLDNPNDYGTTAFDEFGNAVAINSTYAAVSAVGEDESVAASGVGCVYVFSLADGSLTYTLTNPNAFNTPNFDAFGRTLGMSESYLIVGVPTEDDVKGLDAGKVYIYDLSDGSLIHTLDDPLTSETTSTNDVFGLYGVAITETHVAVGSVGKDDPSGANSGRAYVYEFGYTPGQFITDLDTGTGFNGQVFDITLQPDGKILVGGSFSTYNDTSQIRIARLNADGTRDTGFNIGSGFQTIRVNAIAVQTDGKILVGGDFNFYNGVEQNYIARINADGTLDTDFATNIGSGFDDVVRKIIVRSDGKITVGGDFTSYNGTTQNRITRLNTDGTRDTGFSIGTGFNGSVRTMTLQPDNKIVAGGIFTSYNGTTQNQITRINADGTRDTGFSIGTGFNSNVLAVTRAADGNIFVGGDFTTYNGTSTPRLAKLSSTGTLDTTFNTNIGTGPNSTVKAIAVESDGRILLGGDLTSFNGTLQGRITRLNANGTRDTSFDIGTGFSLPVETIALLGNRILVGGQFTTYDSISAVRIAKIATSTLVLKHIINNPNAYGTTVSDSFGRGLAMSDDRILIASSDDPTGDSRGQGYMFDLTDGSLLYTIDNPDIEFLMSGSDDFGLASSVAMTANYACIGAQNENEPLGESKGRAYFYVHELPTVALAITASSTTIVEGESVTFTVNTTNVSPGTVLYWQAQGVASPTAMAESDFAAASGTATVTGTSLVITVTTVYDPTVESTKAFRLEIRTYPTQDTPSAFSETVTVNQNIIGEEVFTTAGTFNWEVPTGVTSVCVVCVGGGGSSATSTPTTGNPGGNSSFGAFVTANGGAGGRLTGAGNAAGGTGTAIGGDVGGGNGGAGGRRDSGTTAFAAGAGGAGGYSGNGGAGANVTVAASTGSGAAGSGGAGGGGAAADWGGGGGGVGLFGEGENGAGGTSTSAAGGGSGGGNGAFGGSLIGKPGGAYGGGGAVDATLSLGGGGGGGLRYRNNISVTPGDTITVTVGAGGAQSGVNTGAGGGGAVRIIWGNGRAFPSTDVGLTP